VFLLKYTKVIGKVADKLNNQLYKFIYIMNETKEENSQLKWYVRRGDQPKGPFLSAKIRHFVLEEKLELTDEVSLDKITWKQIQYELEVMPLSLREDDSEDDRLRFLEKKNNRRKSWITISVLIMIILGVLWFVVEPPSKDVEQVVNCRAKPETKVNWHGCRMRNIQLSGVDLSHADLGSVQMINTNLTEANLSSANLKYANLSTSNLGYALFTNADLTGANLASTDLTNTDFTGANLSYSDLTKAKLGSAVFEKTNLSGAIWVDGQTCAADSIGKCIK